MNANQRPTELIMAILAGENTLKFSFDDIVKARKFQRSITGTITRMLNAKAYRDYFVYLGTLRVLRDVRDVYVGPDDKMPQLYGNVIGEQVKNG